MFKKYTDNQKYTESIISKFPHMYNRNRDSNNYFLLLLYLSEIREASKSLYTLLESLDIMKAKGYTLDNFGTSFNIQRNGESDENYRTRILSELVSKSRNSTFETLVGVLRITVENFDNNIFIFKEGIRKTEREGVNDLNIYSGNYNGKHSRINFEAKGGTIYIVLNKKLPLKVRENIKTALLEVRAKGVEIVIDFKYRIQQASYICNGMFVGTKRMLEITDSFFDEILQEKSMESGLSKMNVTIKEGVR